MRENKKQFKPSMKLLKHMAECKERGLKDRLYYDECGFSFKTKKNQKWEMSINLHEQTSRN